MRVLSLLIAILCSAAVWAQDTKNMSKVKLKDGSELHVLIIENIPGDYIKVELPGNQEATIAYSAIVSIKQDGFSYRSKYQRNDGLFWDGSFAFVFGQASQYGGSPRAGMELGASLNYRFNPYISTGIGVEPMFFFFNNDVVFVPVYARFKGLVSQKRVTPFYALDAGWSFAEQTASNEALSTEGGWFVRNTIGIQAGHFSVGIGYQLQKVITTRENGWGWTINSTTKEERLMKNILFKTNYTF